MGDALAGYCAIVEVDELFASDTAGLVAATPAGVITLRDGDHFGLEIAPVVKHVNDTDVRVHAYNGSIPGPTLHVVQGSAVTVHVTNHGDLVTTVHWDGGLLADPDDGVPDDIEAPIPIGGTYSATLSFSDAGMYWYHPDRREDIDREMGLYGTIVVEPSDDSSWPVAVDRDVPRSRTRPRLFVRHRRGGTDRARAFRQLARGPEPVVPRLGGGVWPVA